METTTDGFFRDLEIAPRGGAAGIQLLQRLLYKVKRRRGSISLEVSTSPIPLECIAPLWNLPLKLRFRQKSGFGQIDLDAVAGRLDVANVDQAGERRGP